MKLRDLLDVLRSDHLDDAVEPYLWSDATLTRRLNNAVREACIRARLLKDDADSNPTLCERVVQAGEARVRFDRSILVPRSAILEGHGCKLYAVTSAGMDKLEPGWDNGTAQPGTPRYMIMDLTQKTLVLWPAPDAAYTLRLRVWRMPQPSEWMRNPDDCPVIEIPDAEELTHWAAYEAFMKKDAETQDPTKAADHLALFEQRFGKRPSLHEMARWADSPPSPHCRGHLF